MLIKGGTILDGTGKPRYAADVRIEGEEIKEIGKLTGRRKEKVINAAGKFVCPGFVDIINRSDIHFSIFEKGGLRSIIRQGVTTILGGSCGASLAPIVGPESIKALQKWVDISDLNINWSNTKEFLDVAATFKPSINFATLTGHATLRRGIVGDSFSALSAENLKKIIYLLDRALEEGSFGLSLGLAYSHEQAAEREELEQLAKIVKKKKCLLAVHLRDEGRDLPESVEEIIGIAKKHKISAHIYHFKGFGRAAWGIFPRALESIEKARKDGVNITFDVYPYSVTSSVLYLLLPRWATAGGRAEVLKRLRDKNTRAKIRDELQELERDFENITIARGNVNHIFFGKTLGEIASNQGVSAIDALFNMLIAAEDQIITFMPFLNDVNVEMALKSPAGMISSDGYGYNISKKLIEGFIHPRSFGAFPKFLREFVGEKNSLTWEEAIYKITHFPASKIGLEKRGKIQKGYFADVAIFDPKAIADKASFKDPFQYAEGIEYVLINGGFALKHGKFQKIKHGRVLRKA